MYVPHGQLMKHVGKHAATKDRLALLYTQLPDDSLHSLVLFIDNLPNIDRDEVNILLHSEEGQRETDFINALHKHNNLLTSLFNKGYIKKVSVREVIMLPHPTQPVPLVDVINARNKAKGFPTVEELEATATAMTKETEIALENSAVPEVLAEVEETQVTKKKPLTVAEKKEQAQLLLLEVKTMEKEIVAKKKEAAKLDPTLKDKLFKKATVVTNTTQKKTV